jgi:hypothetical protein
VKIISYRFHHNRCEAIVIRKTKEGVQIRAARHPNGRWHDYGLKGARLRLYDGDISDLIEHPDPDAAWADYCAAVLRGDVS